MGGKEFVESIICWYWCHNSSCGGKFSFVEAMFAIFFGWVERNCFFLALLVLL